MRRRGVILLSLCVSLTLASAPAAAGWQAEPPGGGGASSANAKPDSTLDSYLGTWNKGVLLFLGGGAFVFFTLFIVAAARGQAPRLESHWGGFGGGLGGWQLSPALAYLFAAVLLSCLLTMLASDWMGRGSRPAANSPSSAPAALPAVLPRAGAGKPLS